LLNKKLLLCRSFSLYFGLEIRVKKETIRKTATAAIKKEPPSAVLLV